MAYTVTHFNKTWHILSTKALKIDHCRHIGFPFFFPDVDNNCQQELAEGTHQFKLISVSCF